MEIWIRFDRVQMADYVDLCKKGKYNDAIALIRENEEDDEWMKSVASYPLLIKLLCEEDFVDLPALFFAVIEFGSGRSLAYILVKFTGRKINIPWTDAAAYLARNPDSGMINFVFSNSGCTELVSSVPDDDTGHVGRMIRLMNRATLHWYCGRVELDERIAVLKAGLQGGDVRLVNEIMTCAPLKIPPAYVRDILHCALMWSDIELIEYLISEPLLCAPGVARRMIERDAILVEAAIGRIGPCVHEQLGLDVAPLNKKYKLIDIIGSLPTAIFLGSRISDAAMFGPGAQLLSDLVGVDGNMPAELVYWVCSHPSMANDCSLRWTSEYLSQYEEYADIVFYLLERAEKRYNTPMLKLLYECGLEMAAAEHLRDNNDPATLISAINFCSLREHNSELALLMERADLSVITDSMALEVLTNSIHNHSSKITEILMSHLVPAHGSLYRQAVLDHYITTDTLSAQALEVFFYINRHHAMQMPVSAMYMHVQYYTVMSYFTTMQVGPVYCAVAAESMHRLAAVLFHGMSMRDNYVCDDPHVNKMVQMARGPWNTRIHALVGSSQMKRTIRALHTVSIVLSRGGSVYLPVEIWWEIVSQINPGWFAPEPGILAVNPAIIDRLVQLWSIAIYRLGRK